MPYPEALVRPMREELTRLGVRELGDAAAVHAFFDEARQGTSLLVVNSVCGCAAAMARPAVAMAMQSGSLPDRFGTVFAGQDLEATATARDYLAGIPPSSPFIAILRDGEPVFVLERRHIERRSAPAIAMDLVGAYGRYCAAGDGADSLAASDRPGDGAEPAAPRDRPGGEEDPPASRDRPDTGDLPKTFRSIL